MRSYPRNSPEAAARLVALLLIADGHVCRSEIEVLKRLEVEQALGLAPGTFGAVVQDLCEDLLMGAYGSGAELCSVDEGLLAALLAEVSDPQLQREVMVLSEAAADADRHISDAESLVLDALHQHWKLGAHRLPASAARTMQPAA